METPKKRKKKRFKVLEDRILSYERPLLGKSNLNPKTTKVDNAEGDVKKKLSKKARRKKKRRLAAKRRLEAKKKKNKRLIGMPQIGKPTSAAAKLQSARGTVDFHYIRTLKHFKSKK
jgi:hypothetical protein